ncbi:phage major capsid protein [Pseudoduganella sp. RAF19]|uniref:phage major capsid protein n=2 Tax=cellular organisms TaxID=131567 RepID=UPI003F94B7C6
MSKLALLREQRDVLAKQIHELNAKTPSDKRMSSEDAEKIDKILDEVAKVDAEIAREQKVTQLAGQTEEAMRNDHTVDPSKQSDESKALRAFLAGGVMNMGEADRQRMHARQNADIRAAMSTTTTTEGGYTTALEYQHKLESAMKAYGGMRGVATNIRTGTGITMNFPTSDATSEIGEIVGQNSAVTGLDTTFGNITLDVYKYSSKKIALPFELVQDSFIDIEAYIQSVLAMRLGRIQNTHYTVGTGTGQPRGLVTAAGSGKVGTTGQTTSVIYDDLVDLEHSVDPAYRNQAGVGYMMHDTTVKAIRKIKDGQNRPIFVPGYEANAMINGGAPDTLMGRPIAINQDMPVMAANAKSILFGQFNKYIVRDVMDLTMFRMTDSAFTLLGQIGFVAFMRTGGNLIDVGGAVKYYANSAT